MSLIEEPVKWYYRWTYNKNVWLYKNKIIYSTFTTLKSQRLKKNDDVILTYH